MSTTADIVAAMRAKYNNKADILLFEVRDDAGFSAGRSVDAMLMRAWPSRGLDLHGFEFKASRTDWLKELKNPAKADSVFRYCDRWWLVTAEESIVKPGELPSGWGWMNIDAKGALKVKTEAPKLEPLPLHRGLLASLLVRAGGPARADEAAMLSGAKAEGIRIGSEQAKRSAASEIEYLKRQLADVEARVKEFEESTGVHLGHQAYRQIGRRPSDVGRAVRMILDGKFNPPVGELQHLQAAAKRIADDIQSALEMKASLEAAGGVPCPP